MAEQTVIHYEQLKEISQRFAQEGEAVSELLGSTQGKVNDLIGSGWIGSGADAFFKEMSEDVLPGVKRLAEALALAGQFTAEIIKLYQGGETEASEPIKAGSFLEDGTSGGPGRSTSPGGETPGSGGGQGPGGQTPGGSTQQPDPGNEPGNGGGSGGQGPGGGTSGGGGGSAGSGGGGSGSPGGGSSGSGSSGGSLGGSGSQPGAGNQNAGPGTTSETASAGGMPADPTLRDALYGQQAASAAANGVVAAPAPGLDIPKASPAGMAAGITGVVGGVGAAVGAGLKAARDKNQAEDAEGQEEA